MNAKRILAGIAVAGGLAAGALGVSTGVASADGGWEPNGGICLGHFCV